MMKNTIRAVIFDMDGVLIDSEPVHYKAWKETLESVGIPFERELSDLFIGVPDFKVAQYVAEQYRLSAEEKQLLERKKKIYREMMEKSVKGFPGVVEGLRSLDSFSLGLATSSCRQEAVMLLDALGIREFFGAIVTSDDVKRPKPMPDTYLHATSLLGIPPEECIAIEDSTHGIRSAASAGLFVLAVETSHDGTMLQQAGAQFKTTKEAIGWILKHCSGN